MKETPGKMYALAIILTLLALLAIMLRFHARRIKKAGYSWDDYMILPAMLFTVVTAICMIIGAAAGDLGRHTTILSSGMPDFNRRTTVFLQTSYACLLTQTLTFGFTKLSVLLFYRRVFNARFLQIAAWTMTVVVCVWTVAFFFSNLLQCYPISTNWIEFGYEPNLCVNTGILFLAQAYSDVFTDVIILSLPLPCIWMMQMPTRHKLAVSTIFLLGTLTVMAGVAKLIIFHIINQESSETAQLDMTYLTTPTVYWPMVESSLGIVGACLPLLRPLFGNQKPRGIVRQLRSVVIPSIHLDDEAGTSSEQFAKFGSGSTLRPYDDGIDSHEFLDTKSLPDLPLERLGVLDDLDEGKLGWTAKTTECISIIK